MIHNINYSDAHLLCTTTDVREARMYNTINVIVLYSYVRPCHQGGRVRRTSVRWVAGLLPSLESTSFLSCRPFYCIVHTFENNH